jgi:hypothetical protein
MFVILEESVSNPRIAEVIERISFDPKRTATITDAGIHVASNGVPFGLGFVARVLSLDTVKHVLFEDGDQVVFDDRLDQIGKIFPGGIQRTDSLKMRLRKTNCV